MKYFFFMLFFYDLNLKIFFFFFYNKYISFIFVYSLDCFSIFLKEIQYFVVGFFFFSFFCVTRKFAASPNTLGKFYYRAINYKSHKRYKLH